MGNLPAFGLCFFLNLSHLLLTLEVTCYFSLVGLGQHGLRHTGVGRFGRETQNSDCRA